MPDLAGKSKPEIMEAELHRFKHGQLHSGPDKYGHIVKDRRQAIAIAMSEARRHGRAYGGQAPFTGQSPWWVRSEARGMTHVGPIHGAVAGRTDHVPLTVPNGSYVLPAEHVSHLGQGNTMAGFARLNHMFPITHGHGAPSPPGVRLPSPPKSPFKAGGVVDHGGDGVPIMGASGEYVLHPDDVRKIGLGNISHGHDVLDAWVKKTKEDQIRTLKKLPGPAK
jgi:Family of unknown function (DUF6496)